MIIARAPLRVSFFGGGTDYPEYFLQEGGAVLASAIDKFSYITASRFFSRLFDYAIRISYRKVELARRLDEIEHNVYRECLRLCDLDCDVELHAVADLPAFSGLGSSSTFTVSLLHALHSFKGEFVTPLALAYEAIHIERAVLRDRVGCQDQVMAAVGGFNVLEFRREDDVIVHRLPVSLARIAELEAHLFVVFTGITRRAAEVVASQLERAAENRDTLRTMRAMVDEGAELLIGSRPMAEFGDLLHRAWQAKRSLSARVSNSEIDQLYAMGRAAGALGGKLLGAGGGGFMVFVAPPESHARLRQTFSDYQQLSVKLNAPGSQIIFAA
jgi:D-glycero-alpha-D-manno-heptose-7-phosphate kinase